MEELTWKNVFNSEHFYYGHISHMYNIVKNTGYKWCAWNGYVYEVKDNGLEPTSIKTQCIA